MSAPLKFWAFLWTIWIAEGTVVFEARCRSRCHLLYKSRLEKNKLSQCLSPCEQDYAKLGSCRDFCRPWGDDNAPCHYSCKEYKNVYISDYGSRTCSTRSSKKGLNYDDYCDRNIRCDELKKCCSRTNMCQDIVVHGEEVKAVVSHVTSSSLVVSWKASNITGAVYIVQVREVNSRTIHYRDHDWLPWQHIKQGVKFTAIKVIHLIPGVRYQLRIAVANSSGLQSIGPSTSVIRTLFNASRPSGPEQVWVTKKSYKQKSVSVTLVWTPPAILDVPVHNYRIYWKEIPIITADRAVLTKKRTRVSGSQYNYTIENLKPDTTYNIELEAICLWQKKRLKSPKVSLNISTGHIKDTGRGIIDVYFNKNRTSKDKEGKQTSERAYDKSIKNIEVFIEKQEDTTKTPTKDPSESNSARRKRPDPWLILIWLLFFLIPFWTN